MLCDDGKQLGVRYYEDGPTYAWTMVRRIGACSTDQGARGAVERALEEGKVGFTRGRWSPGGRTPFLRSECRRTRT